MSKYKSFNSHLSSFSCVKLGEAQNARRNAVNQRTSWCFRFAKTRDLPWKETGQSIIQSADCQPPHSSRAAGGPSIKEAKEAKEAKCDLAAVVTADSFFKPSVVNVGRRREKLSQSCTPAASTLPVYRLSLNKNRNACSLHHTTMQPYITFIIASMSSAHFSSLSPSLSFLRILETSTAGQSIYLAISPPVSIPSHRDTTLSSSTLSPSPQCSSNFSSSRHWPA